MALFRRFLLPVLFLCAGCGGKSEDEPSEAGGSESGSAPLVPARGAFHGAVEFSLAAAPENACALPSIGGVGGPSPPEMPIGTVAGDSAGQLVTDGDDVGDGGTAAYVVSCSIEGETRREIAIELQGPNTSASAGATNKGLTSLILTGTLDADGSGSGSATVRTPFSGATESSDCEFFEASDYAVGDYGVALTFLCSEATTALDPYGVCQTRGVVIVENCD